MANTNHSNVKCDHCGACPIIGIRFKCGNCIDYDLCQSCISQRNQFHEPSHCFLFLDGFVDMNASNPPLLRTIVFPPAAFVLKNELRVEGFCGSLVEFVHNSPPSKWKATTVGEGMNGNDRALNVEKRACSTYDDTPPKILLSTEDQSIVNYAVCQALQIDDANGVTYGESELMVYQKGGHFVQHIDRVRNHPFLNLKHVGVLLFIGFSPDSVGGELVSEGRVVISKSNASTTDAWDWKMCVILSGEKHSINQLQQGFRITYKQSLLVAPSSTRVEAKPPHGSQVFD